MNPDLYNVKLDKGYFYNQRKEMLSFLPQNFSTLLDVGCGGGDFGKLVKESRKAEVWGIDLSSVTKDRARLNLDHFILGSFTSEVDLPDYYFDVITFNDSLEHFSDPIEILHLCKKKLSAGGVIICSLPNVRYIENVIHFLVDMDWKYQDSGILDYTHLRFFTKKSMERLFIESGYKVDSITGIKPHYWSGKKIFLLRLFFKKYIEDMKYLNYVVVARIA